MIRKIIDFVLPEYEYRVYRAEGLLQTVYCKAYAKVLGGRYVTDRFEANLSRMDTPSFTEMIYRVQTKPWFLRRK